MTHSKPGRYKSNSCWTSVALASVLLLCATLDGRAADAPPQTPAELFKIDKVWTIHLTFTPTQWEAMEPRRAGGPGGPPGGFGPGMFLGPAFMSAGDGDSDGKLTRTEFAALAEKWFGQWDKDKSGKVDT